MNQIKLVFLMALMTALIVAVGGWLGGTSMMAYALVFAVLMNFGVYWFSDRAVLKMYRAQVVSREQAPELYDMVDRLRRRAGLPMPTVAIAPSDQPNAFATGRSPEHAVVCFTQGILRLVPKEELEGVTAHELAHIRGRDMLIGTVAAALAGVVTYLSYLAMFIPLGGGRDRNPLVGLLTILVAPIAAALIRMAVSRTMEFRADRAGAEIAGNPRGLASALQRLEAHAKRIPMQVSPAAAHLCIVNPLRGGGGFAALFRTHPPTEERVRRLEAMARGR